MVRDKSQDYQLVVGYQYQGGTVLRFKRKINTCDGDDLVITVRIFRVFSNFNSLQFFFTCFRTIHSEFFGGIPTRIPETKLNCQNWWRIGLVSAVCISTKPLPRPTLASGSPTPSSGWWHPTVSYCPPGVPCIGAPWCDFQTCPQNTT